MQVDTHHIGRATQPEGWRVQRRKYRLLSLVHLDRRTIQYRRASALAKSFAAQAKCEVPATVRILIERAATLQALTEDRRARVLNGEAIATLNDLVRLDRLAAQARREMVREIGKLRRSRAKPSALDGLRPIGVDHGEAD